PAAPGRRVRDPGVDHDGLRLGRCDVLAVHEQARRLHLVPAEHRAADGRLGRTHDRQIKALAADPRLDRARCEASRRSDAHTNTPAWRSPAVSFQPKARFAFWIACPAAPLPRLSSAQMTTARPVERSSYTAISAVSVPCTRESSGSMPSGRTSTSGESA